MRRERPFLVGMKEKKKGKDSARERKTNGNIDIDSEIMKKSILAKVFSTFKYQVLSFCMP